MNSELLSDEICRHQINNAENREKIERHWSTDPAQFIYLTKLLTTVSTKPQMSFMM